MPPFQTSQATVPAKGYPGMLSDMSEWTAVSGFTQAATLRPGDPVQYGTGERTHAPLGSGRFKGILRGHITAAPGGVFRQDEMIAAVTMGHIFVRPGGVCTLGGPVYWNQAANSGEGGYSDTDTGTLILGAEFAASATATDDVVLVELIKVPGGIPAP